MAIHIVWQQSGTVSKHKQNAFIKYRHTTTAFCHILPPVKIVQVPLDLFYNTMILKTVSTMRTSNNTTVQHEENEMNVCNNEDDENYSNAKIWQGKNEI